MNQLEVRGFSANRRRNRHSGHTLRLNIAIRYADFAIFMKGGAAGPIRKVPKS